MTDDELEPYLSGSQGLVGLDMARELVGLRVQLGQALERLSAMEQTALGYAAVAETAMAERASARARLKELAECFAGLNAETREFLGES